ncbi:TPA: helix-turn-helix domain-containing protein [Providencia alcalifaciens]
METQYSFSYVAGYFIRKSRIRMGLTGAQLADLINMSQQQVSRYETGRSKLSLDQLDELLNVLGRSWSELIDFIENKFQPNSLKPIYLHLNDIKNH